MEDHSAHRIYVIEDNQLIREGVTEYFKVYGYETLEFAGVQGVLETLRVRPPHAVILDIMLPDGNGYMLAKEIRTRSDTPILFLTAKEEESDRIMGFEVGGDDYIVKPFSNKELLLRTQAVMRRAEGDSSEARVHGRWHLGEDALELDCRTRQAYVNDRELHLTNAEWNILSYLAFREHQAVSRSRILGECLGYNVEGSERTIDTHIANLRAHLGRRDWLETVRGFGYRFHPEYEE